MSREKGNTKGLYFTYRSMLDGSKCVATFTCVSKPSTNPKTGDMIQVSFYPQATPPSEARKNGGMRGVCGDCPMATRCYVTWHHQNSTWHAWKRGSYERLDLTNERHIQALRAKPIRFGAAGDPASVPYWFWEMFFRYVKPKEYTGYTHQWRRFPEFQRFLMASVESDKTFKLARSLGFRTFHCRRQNETIDRTREIQCMAAKEAGHSTQCSKCLLCSGTRFFEISHNVRSISIQEH